VLGSDLVRGLYTCKEKRSRSAGEKRDDGQFRGERVKTCSQLENRNLKFEKWMRTEERSKPAARWKTEI
jgi:hypothetical protein